jgi:hypothetical protein
MPAVTVGPLGTSPGVVLGGLCADDLGHWLGWVPQVILAGKVRAVWAVRKVPGSFAALRMTAGTNNGKNRSRSPSGMTTRKTTARTTDKQRKSNGGLASLDAHSRAIRLRMSGAPGSFTVPGSFGWTGLGDGAAG